MSRRAKEEYQRSYRVTDPRSHPKGYTEYKVTAKFVSKVNPDDVKEVVVWKRYSDFKKLHGDLAYTHRNLFRRTEEFPSFPKAHVFGRFDPEVIEERRKAAEVMLDFTVHIPALNNSPQLKEFFRGGEGQSHPGHSDLPSLPHPLIPVPAEGVEPGEDALRSICEDGFLDSKPESGSRNGSSESRSENREGAPIPMNVEDLEDLFASGEEEEGDPKESSSPSHSLLSVQELALFDPFSKDASDATSLSHGVNLASPASWGPGPDPFLSADETQKTTAKEGGAVSESSRYLDLATERIRKAVECEAAKDYQGAFQGYRRGVDLLLQGLHGDHDVVRREAVKKKTSEYLQRAEEIFQQHLKDLEL